MEGCTVSIISALTGVGNTVWNFGDGSAPVVNPTSFPSHTYTASGIYSVSVQFNDKPPCYLPVKIDCGATNSCCTADFTAVAAQKCAKLTLSLEASCNTGGTHTWSIVPGNFQVLNLTNNVSSQEVQITDIDLEVTNSFTVVHTYTCENGQVLTQTKTVQMEGNKGIYIGVEGISTNLTQYTNTLPGGQYNGSSGKPVYVSGLIRIDKSFAFKTTEVQFNPGMTGFDVIYHTASLTFSENSILKGVDEPCSKFLWRGIKVYNRGRFYAKSVLIRDALKAVDISGQLGTVTQLEKVQFIENFVGIYTSRSIGFFEMNNTVFDGGSGIREAGDLLTIANNSFTVQANTFWMLENLVFNSTRGFAGIYSDQSNITLPELPQGSRNTFKNLNYGIIVHDGNIALRKNAIFIDINAGGYTYLQTGAIALFDAKGGGNTISVIGSLDEGTGLPDIQRATMGISIRTLQGLAPTQLGIENINMDDVFSGIYLYTVEGNSTVIGHSNNTPSLAGIHSNRIRITNLAGGPLNSHGGGGICYSDRTAVGSNVEVYNNEILVQQSAYFLSSPTWEDWVYYQGGKGIVYFGPNFLTNAGTVTKLDIHDNRIVISGEGQTGICNTNSFNTIIRNNRGGDINSGNGIFSTSDNFNAGIIDHWGWETQILCNDVETITNPNTEAPLYWNISSINGQTNRNDFRGPGRGAYFFDWCEPTEYRCNTMAHNTIGLYYGFFGRTGLQGSETEASGNIWEGNSFQWQAYHEDFALMAESQYFVRNVSAGNTTERPTLQFPIGVLWFRTPLNSSFSLDCNTGNCPVEPGIVAPPVISSTDSLIALNAGTFEESVRWQRQYDLYQMLSAHPFLVQTNSLMSEFMDNMSGSIIASYFQLQAVMENGVTPSSTLVTAVQGNELNIKLLTEEINVLDNTISGGVNSIGVDALTTERSVKDSLLGVLNNENDLLYSAYKTDVSNAINLLIPQVSAWTVNNQCESNLKNMFLAYLESVPVGQPWSSGTQVLMKSIAEQCPATGGIGVIGARALYMQLVGHDLEFDNCDSGNKERSDKSSSDGSVLELSLFPNPTNGEFKLQIPDTFKGEKAIVTVTNSNGGTVLQNTHIVSIVPVRLNLSDQPKGTYYITVNIGGKELKASVLLLK